MKYSISSAPLWDLAFRPFFLFGSLFSVVAMTLWALLLSGEFAFTPYGNVYFWHMHEMIFGFVGAIVMGFLLTAVQNWTGIRAPHGYSLLFLFSLWLFSRIAMLGLIPISGTLIATIDAGTYLVAALLFGRVILLSGNYRNMILIPVLLMFALANFFTHASLLFSVPYLLNLGTHSAVFIITLSMMVIGGRVIPLFTANALKIALPPALKKLEIVTIASTVLIVILYLTNTVNKLPGLWVAAVFLFAGACHALRAKRWFVTATLKHPMLWSLHLSYWFIPLSFILFAGHYAGLDISHSTAVHGLTAGAMSSLILSMIARVSLGHTGRPIQAKLPIKIGFGVILLTGLSRVLVDVIFESTSLPLYMLTAIAWCIPYAVFVVFYAKILTQARAK